jgi:hypothetical protein
MMAIMIIMPVINKLYNIIIMKCPSGMITRNSYKRKQFINKKGTIIKSRCIKSRGLPGKTSLRNKGIGKLKSGELGKHGYFNVKNIKMSKRRKALSSAIDDYGAQMLLKKLNALRVYQKNTNPKISSIFYQDMRWLRKKYNHQFKSHWKSSSLYQ